MLRQRSSSLAVSLLAVGLCAVALPAHAQEAPPAPPPGQQQLQPLPAQQPSTVVVQQYPAPVYQQAPVYQGPPVYQGQPIYQPGYQPPPYYIPAQPLQSPGGPRIIRDWDSSQPIPPGYHKEEHIRTGLVIGGAVTFGSFYLLSALAASISADANEGGSNPIAGLWVPGVGPFIAMTQVSSATADFALAIDGLAQLAGLTMFTVGLAAPKTELVRNDFGSLHLEIKPIVGRDFYGSGLVGHF